MSIYFSLLAATIYIVCPFLPTNRMRLALGLAIIAWCFHGAALGMTVFSNESIRVGFAIMYSSALWISVLVYVIENRNFSLDSLRPLVLPQAAIAVVMPLFFQGSLVDLNGKTAMFPWHIGVALLAYSTLTIAAFHAFVMYFQDVRLHQMSKNLQTHWFDKAIDRLPAILKMERILLFFILLGFIFLSLTVLSGVIFSEQVLGVAFKWDHKTILSLLSWVLFGVLLTGSYWRGWRGKIVLKMTFFGFVSLLMAYVGSRFVIEVLLQRSIL